MHKALPKSIAGTHSMTTGGINGMGVYEKLLAARDKHGKLVYVLASHSHYYSPSLFDTSFWRTHGGVLDGWIIGTAGAQRYALPKNPPEGATNQHYGYMLATVNPPGAPQGTITFKFQPIEESDVPETVKGDYPKNILGLVLQQEQVSQRSAGY